VKDFPGPNSPPHPRQQHYLFPVAFPLRWQLFFFFAFPFPAEQNRTQERRREEEKRREKEGYKSFLVSSKKMASNSLGASLFKTPLQFESSSRRVE